MHHVEHFFHDFSQYTKSNFVFVDILKKVLYYEKILIIIIIIIIMIIIIIIIIIKRIS